MTFASHVSVHVENVLLSDRLALMRLDLRRETVALLDAVDDQYLWQSPDILDAAAAEIDCGKDCAYAWREADTNAGGCHHDERGEGYCRYSLAETLRQMAKARRALDEREQLDEIAAAARANERRLDAIRPGKRRRGSPAGGMAYIALVAVVAIMPTIAAGLAGLWTGPVVAAVSVLTAFAAGGGAAVAMYLNGRRS